MRRVLIAGTSLTLVVAVVIGQAYSQGEDPAFEELFACEQLDSIAGSGKDVAKHIADSGFDKFGIDVVETCPHYLVELGRAWHMAIAVPASGLFEDLAACEQLAFLESHSEEPITDHIEKVGFRTFAYQILEDCPRHLEALGTVWQRRNAQVPVEEAPQTPVPLSVPVVDPIAVFPSNIDLDFEARPPCEKLDIIKATGKSVPEYLAGSGIEEFDDAIRETCTRHLPSLNEAFKLVGLDPAFETLAPCQQREVMQQAENLAFQ